MTANVSSLALQITSIRQVKDIQSRMVGYQEQVATGVKSQTFAGYGSQASHILNYRGDLAAADMYLQNIEIAQTTLEQMSTSISETEEQAGNVMSALNIQLLKGSDFDLDSIKSAASAALQIIQTNMNTKIGDKYLFAGTDVSNAPYASASTATSNIQAEISDWLDGTSTSSAFLTNLDNLTDSEVGYSTTVQASKKVYIRADNDVEVDYTVKANEPGFKKIVVALNALANIEKPATGDVPTDDEFYDVLNSLYRTVKDGVDDLRSSNVTLASAASIIDDVKTSHQNDIQAFQKTMEKTEAADTTDALVKFQTLQTQLEASYQVTALLSQLSLARIL